MKESKMSESNHFSGQCHKIAFGLGKVSDSLELGRPSDGCVS